MPDLRPLHQILANLNWFARGLVLVRGRHYGRIEDLARDARRDAVSGTPEARKALNAMEFWVERDRQGKVVVMRQTSRGPEPYYVEAGSLTRVPIPEEEEYWEETGLHGPSVGRARPCTDGGIRFEGRCFEPGNYYTWDDLTAGMKRDVLLQQEDVEALYRLPVENLTYRFLLVPNESLLLEIYRRFGEGASERVRTREVQAIVRSIERHGLKSPPVGEEGWKRALALAYLDMDMPYISIVPPFEAGPFAFAALEGLG